MDKKKTMKKIISMILLATLFTLNAFAMTDETFNGLVNALGKPIPSDIPGNSIDGYQTNETKSSTYPNAAVVRRFSVKDRKVDSATIVYLVKTHKTFRVIRDDFINYLEKKGFVYYDDIDDDEVRLLIKKEIKDLSKEKGIHIDIFFKDDIGASVINVVEDGEEVGIGLAILKKPPFFH
ncbi:MAG: hypothetical protein LBV16_08325 [Elusimicrobiota bacterium]|jgi:hypothetical protein|nr:hypothetical protein [Elusimicrobiota bacterium]